MKVIVKALGIENTEKQYPTNTTVEEIVKDFQYRLPYPVYCCKLDNAYRGLTHKVYHDCEIELLDIRTNVGWYTYQNSLILLYIKAVHDILGKEVMVSVKNSLSKGLFTTIRGDIDEEIVKKISKHMQELVQKDLPIEKVHLKREEAMELALNLKQKETYELLKTINEGENVEIYHLDDETQIFYDFLLPSTGYLKLFELRMYRGGVIVRYPHQSSPSIIPEYKEQGLLYEAFAESTHWGYLMDANYVVDLNKKITNNDMSDLYLLQEALHEKKISDIADEIVRRKKRIVLICGPSSSGKTTFAKRLCIQLGVCGCKTLYMGTDDYFVEREDNPVDENGEKDYECIEAVDNKLFVTQMNDLLVGKEVDLPTFDFKDGKKKFGKRITKLDNNEVIVIEGIHALNDVLIGGIDDSAKFKIYISPFTPIAIDHHNRIPTTDCRLLRRMVRDNQFRGYSAQTTIKSWPKVRAGEEKNIFPYNEKADVFFNSNCIYELSVLKKYAAPLLKAITRKEEEYAEAQRLLSFFRFFDEANDDNVIANNSIVREFIGGSVIVK